jgi:hypothetical protein
MLDANFPLSLSKLHDLARKSGLVQRHSHRFSGPGFLLGLLRSVTKGDTSLNHIAMHLGGFHARTMTRQAVHQRMSPASSSFLLQVIDHLLAKHCAGPFEQLREGPFKRVLIEDSTVISMAKSNAENFPNNGNGRTATAGCKCLLLADLISGKPIVSQLHAARQADQSLSHEAVEHCRAGDLLVRDMGFFNLESLRRISDRDAFWISRLPVSVSLVADDGTELRELLKRAVTDRLDLPAFVGRDRVPCRLIAIRLSPEDTAKHRRDRKRESAKRGATPSKESALRDGWRLLVTNVGGEQLDANRINEIYGLRWTIEIQFRAFKQSCQISRGLKHRSGFHHIEAMVLAAMIYQLLTLRLHARLARRTKGNRWISIEKISDCFSIYLMRLTADPATWPFDPDLRHLQYERRKRPNHWQTITHCLA